VSGHLQVWIVAGLQVAAAAGIALFWITWFRQGHHEEWLPPGYVEHERAFVFPDALLAALLVASAVLVVTRQPLGRTLSLVCAGMLGFLGILDAAYFWQTGLFARERGGALNALVVAGLLVLGALLLITFG
jgi:hypothetical protein